jgi:hypothetical protein
MGQADNSLLIIATFAFLGQTCAVVVAAWLNHRGAIGAQRAATSAAILAVKVAEANKIATLQAQEDAAKAQAQALEAAKALVEAAKVSDTKLEAVVKAAATADDRLVGIQKIATNTQVLVNGKRSAMLREIADLRRLRATEHPKDKAAQVAALKAEAEASVT